MGSKRKPTWAEDGWGEWGGYMNAKIEKLQEQYKSDLPKLVENQSTNDRSNIFRGIAIFVNGYTVPSADGLKRLMMLHGGIYHHYYRKSATTHIIATNLATATVKHLTTEKIVKPEWITESVKAGYLLPYQNYQLLYQKGNDQQQLPFKPTKNSEISHTVTSSSCFVEADVESARKGGTSCSDLPSNATIDSSLNFATTENEGQTNTTATSSSKLSSPEIVTCSSDKSGKRCVNVLQPSKLERVAYQSSLRSVATESLAPDSITSTSFNSDQFCSKYTTCVKNRGPESVASTSSFNHGHYGTKYTAVTPSFTSASNQGPLGLGSTNASSFSDPNNVPSASSNSRSAMCATNSKFLSEFYGHSRLHHLSTMGAEFRDYVNQLRSNSDGSFPGRIRIKAWKARKRLMSKKEARTSGGSETDVSTTEANTSLLAGKQRIVMHIDMDCFFVSVGIRDKPELKGKPVAVTHSRGVGFTGQTNSALRETEIEYYRQHQMQNSKSRPSSRVPQNTLPQGALYEDKIDEDCDEEISNSVPHQEEFLSSSEIACCSYEARLAGVRNGRFLGEAKKLCPSLQTIPYDFEGYREVSYTLYNTVASYTHNIEAVSCDELYIDCTDMLREMEIGPLDFATILRKEILEKTRCTCSTGIATNMLLARLATRKAKPDGQYLLSDDAVKDFISGQSVRDLPGVGSSLSSRLRALNVETCGNLQKISLAVLQKEFGPRLGLVLHNACRGLDDRQVKPEHHRKSVSAEVNYGIRFTKEEEVEKFMFELSEEVAKRLESVAMKGKTLTLKLKVRRKDAPAESSKFMGHGICDNITKSISLSHPISDAARISQEVMTVFKALNIPPEDMRGVGIQMQRLEACNNSASSKATLLKFFRKSTMNISSTCQNSSATVASHDSAALKNVPPSIKSASITTPDHADFNSSLPPPSQIDREVLLALPEDLRQQILKDYAARGVEINTSLSEQQDSSLTSRNENNGTPGMSVDESFIQALPLEIQMEVKEMLLQQESHIRHSPAKPNVHLLSSPEKYLKTPPKPVRGSPIRRGRKPKSGTKKNLSPKVDAQQPKLFALLKGTRIEEPVKQDTKTTANSVGQSMLKANLCGAVELQDVKQLIQEWVDSCPNPELEDVETISRYLKGLMMERNLERVDLVVKYLYRVIIKTGSKEWKTAYSLMLEDVQKLAVVLHEAPLKLPHFVVT